MSTLPDSASWTIAARSSGGISEWHPQAAELVSQHDQTGGVLVEDRGQERGLRDLERGRDVGRRAAPPDAITGTDTARATSSVNPRS